MNGRTSWPRRPPASHRTESLWTSAVSPRQSAAPPPRPGGSSGRTAYSGGSWEAGSHRRTGGRRQRAPAARGALGPRKQLSPQDRPPPDPRLPAVRRPRVPGGALPRVSRGAGHAGARDEMPLPGGHTTPPIRDNTPRDEAGARRRGRGGLGPRLPLAPRACGLRPGPVESQQQQQLWPAPTRGEGVRPARRLRALGQFCRLQTLVSSAVSEPWPVVSLAVSESCDKTYQSN